MNRMLVRAAGFAAVCFATAPCLAQQGWEWQNPKTQANTLWGVEFFGADTGWVVGENGTIVHTTDGGVTWSNQIRARRGPCSGSPLPTP